MADLVPFLTDDAEWSRGSAEVADGDRAAAEPERSEPARRVRNANDAPTDVDVRSALGYNRSMRSELRVAGQWGAPAADYMNTLRAASQSPQTIYLRGYQLRALSYAFADRSPWEVTGQDLVDYLADQSWSASTKRSARTAIRGFYDWAVREGHVDRSPALALAPVRAPQGRPRPAAMSDVERAIAAAPERVRLMIYLGVQLGLRRAEIAKVHVDDIVRDAEGWVLTVRGKGNRTRMIPLTDRLASLITRAGERHGWVFPSFHKGDERYPTGSHLTASTVGSLVSAALPAGVTTHMLRHRFASDLYVATGNDIRAVQDALGHTSVATTQIYTEVPRSALRRGMEGLALSG